VALLPATAVTAELADGRLTAVAIDGVRPIRRRMVAIRRRGAGPPSGPVAAFYAVLPTIDDAGTSSGDAGDDPGSALG